jgi:hypothetical protein
MGGPAPHLAAQLATLQRGTFKFLGVMAAQPDIT